jgi:hypothetical protein
MEAQLQEEQTAEKLLELETEPLEEPWAEEEQTSELGEPQT